ncbi:hypothetical protein [Clostridium botulinum]|uniref:hypothetical protein n=1 Tax=Clostridium botulinum TaxID=1491 RepID=UPI0007746B6B|nr:hypothetical protein [Clostridium botulinum]
MSEVRQIKKDEAMSYEEAIRVGIREGINYIKQQEYSKTTKRYDRRLRNTRLLLKQYRKLNVHNIESVKSINRIKDNNAIDILDDVESIDDEEQYIQALSRTKVRTVIIIKHINKMLKYYEIICNHEGENKRRGYKAIKRLYIDPIKESEKIPRYESVAEELDISVKTVSRDVKDAIEDLSSLFFGIDGIKL